MRLASLYLVASLLLGAHAAPTTANPCPTAPSVAPSAAASASAATDATTAPASTTAAEQSRRKLRKREKSHDYIPVPVAVPVATVQQNIPVPVPMYVNGGGAPVYNAPVYQAPQNIHMDSVMVGGLPTTHTHSLSGNAAYGGMPWSFGMPNVGVMGMYDTRLFGPPSLPNPPRNRRLRHERADSNKRDGEDEAKERHRDSSKREREMDDVRHDSAARGGGVRGGDGFGGPGYGGAANMPDAPVPNLIVPIPSVLDTHTHTDTQINSPLTHTPLADAGVDTHLGVAVPLVHTLLHGAPPPPPPPVKQTRASASENAEEYVEHTKTHEKGDADIRGDGVSEAVAPPPPQRVSALSVSNFLVNLLGDGGVVARIREQM